MFYYRIGILDQYSNLERRALGQSLMAERRIAAYLEEVVHSADLQWSLRNRFSGKMVPMEAL
jgi:hypothetical protein